MTHNARGASSTFPNALARRRAQARASKARQKADRKAALMADGWRFLRRGGEVSYSPGLSFDDRRLLRQALA